MEFSLAQTSPSPSTRRGPQQGGHAHGAAVGGVQRGGVVRGGLGHEHQVEVRVVGGVEQDLPQHGTTQARRLRRSAGREGTEITATLPMVMLFCLSVFLLLLFLLSRREILSAMHWLVKPIQTSSSYVEGLLSR